MMFAFQCCMVGFVVGTMTSPVALAPEFIQRRIVLLKAWWLVHVTERSEVMFWSNWFQLDLMNRDSGPLVLSLLVPMALGAYKAQMASA